MINRRKYVYNYLRNKGVSVEHALELRNQANNNIKLKLNHYGYKIKLDFNPFYKAYTVTQLSKFENISKDAKFILESKEGYGVFKIKRNRLIKSFKEAIIKENSFNKKDFDKISNMDYEDLEIYLWEKLSIPIESLPKEYSIFKFKDMIKRKDNKTTDKFLRIE